ncbi:hypothetical protein HLY00_3990 [Mycolicibacterium hippocampi]|uniref:Uncharacterized protein n=1 Tax=Mycolicibacterium hippocampi TaxID=659824 RepID=A0A850Q088_9MYCO|nr:hypothetical protein [Mycolicibacterium hippocampi]
MSAAYPEATARAEVGGDALEEIADAALWLCTAIVHHADRVRPNPRAMKVVGHQASCVSWRLRDRGE